MRQLIRSNTLVITILVSIVILVFCCMSAHCQSDTVSATVVDQASTTWANGTWKLQFIPNPNYNTNNVNWNGSPFPVANWLVQGSLSSSGQFSNSTPRNDFITPTGSTWTLTVCPNATSACTVITGLSFTGTSTDLSSQITAASPRPNVKPLPFATAYNDAEVSVNPSNTGYFYLNVTTNSPRYWGQDQAWHDFVTGVESFSAGDLPPLFTTSIGSDPSNPDLTFTLDTVAANKVFANCTTSTAPPSYCSLTVAMIPALPYIPSSTTIFYQTIEANGTAQTQRAATNYSSDFTVTDSTSPARTNVALANTTVTANTYACPASLTINSRGQATSVTAGTCPTATVVARVNFTSCTLIHIGDTEQNCTGTQSWGTTISGTYSMSCIIGVPSFTTGGSSDTTGLTQSTWGLAGPTPLGTTSFNYYLSNIHDNAAGLTVTLSCMAVQ